MKQKFNRIWDFIYTTILISAALGEAAQHHAWWATLWTFFATASLAVSAFGWIFRDELQ